MLIDAELQAAAKGKETLATSDNAVTFNLTSVRYDHHDREALVPSYAAAIYSSMARPKFPADLDFGALMSPRCFERISSGSMTGLASRTQLVLTPPLLAAASMSTSLSAVLMTLPASQYRPTCNLQAQWAASPAQVHVFEARQH